MPIKLGARRSAPNPDRHQALKALVDMPDDERERLIEILDEIEEAADDYDMSPADLIALLQSAGQEPATATEKSARSSKLMRWVMSPLIP